MIKHKENGVTIAVKSIHALFKVVEAIKEDKNTPKVMTQKDRKRMLLRREQKVC